MIKPNKYIKTIKKQGTIQQAFKKGIKKIKIKDILKTSNTEIQNIKKELIKDLVTDEQLLNILSSEENFKKLKNRLDYELKAKNEKGETLIEANVHGKHITEVREEIRKTLKGNQTVNKQKYRILDYLKKLGWEGERKGEGTIKNIELTITFRKG